MAIVEGTHSKEWTATEQSPYDKLSRDRISQVYLGQWGDDYTQAKARRRVEWIVSSVRGDAVLDVGCSEGIIAILIAREGRRVTAIDRHAGALSYARELLAAEPAGVRECAEFLNRDVTSFRAETPFDTVVAGEILEHVQRPERLLRILGDLVTPDSGRLILTTPCGYFPHPDHRQTFTPRQLAELVSEQFRIEHFSIADEYIRVIARRPNDGPVGELDLLDLTEQAMLASQRAKSEYIANLLSKLRSERTSAQNREAEARRRQSDTEKIEKSLRDSIRVLEEERSRAGSHADSARKELETVRAGLVAHADALVEELASVREERSRLERRVEELLGESLTRNDEHRSHIDKARRLAFDRLSESQQTTQALRGQLERTNRLRRRSDRQLRRSEAGRGQLELRLAEAIAAAERSGEAHRAEVDCLTERLRNALTNAERLSRKLDSATEAHRAEQRSAEDAFSALENRLDETQTEVRERQQETGRQRKHIEGYRGRLDSANRELKHLREMLLRSQEQLRTTQHDFEEHRASADEIRRSASFKVGREIARAFDKPGWRTLLLPLAMFRAGYPLLVGWWRNRANRGPATVPSAPAPVSAKRREPVPGKAHKFVPFEPRQRIDPDNLGRLRVAAILDEFSYFSFRDVCLLEQITPDDWRSELERFQPDLLLVESAWTGKEGKWTDVVSRCKPEFTELMRWVRAERIPAAFWNKEDPVHFEAFLPTAALFDFVFTTDIDSVTWYKTHLGHDRVYLLPFAANPRQQNPIETFERKDGFCFAGSYYAKRPERARDTDSLIDVVQRLAPLDVFDRHHGSGNEMFRFPERFRKFIRGKLPFQEIDRAYKGYAYAVNLNIVKHSQTMFARRVFELLACNTVVVSNYSWGVRLLFGDAVVSSDNQQELEKGIQLLRDDPIRFRKVRLAALRKVMSEHTYGDRLAWVAHKAFGSLARRSLPSIAVFADISSDEEFDHLMSTVERQAVRPAEVIVLPTAGYRPRHTRASVRIVGDRAIVSDLNAEWLAYFHPDDYYGRNYLTDLILATRYSDATAFGKRAFYQSSGGTPTLNHEGEQYHLHEFLLWRAAVVKVDSLGQRTLRELVSQRELRSDQRDFLSLDEFNYCRGCRASQVELVDDLAGLDTGIGLAELNRAADRVAPVHIPATTRIVRGNDIAHMLGQAKDAAVSLEPQEDRSLLVSSSLPAGKHTYIYAGIAEPELFLTGGQLQVRLETRLQGGEVDVRAVFVYRDTDGARLGADVVPARRFEDKKPPAGTTSIQFGLRVAGPGEALVTQLMCGSLGEARVATTTQADSIVVTPEYPEYGNIYRHMFVHHRVLAYRELGFRPDVFRLNEQRQSGWFEFQGVDVASGGVAAFEEVLRSGNYRRVLIHFLDTRSWQAVQDKLDELEVIIWLHGAEVQHWRRRRFNFLDERALQHAKDQSDARMLLWKDVFARRHPNLKFVFVSRYFAEEVMEDHGVRLPKNSIEIVHNPIDTELFPQLHKSAEARKRILSIRPFASPKYANDLTVQAILELRDDPRFSQLEFTIVGSGPLFSELTAPLVDLPNVTLREEFLLQHEIAELHRAHGIFLSPTRMDSQGVSRDEAMSSGLVPVTNRITAVPEFVDDSCGILVPPEDPRALADAIRRLFDDPELFLSLSAGAAARVRQQSAKTVIIPKELALIGAAKQSRAAAQAD